MIRKEFTGYGSIAALKPLLTSRRFKKVFLVTGGKSFSLCGAEKILAPLLSACEVTRFPCLSEFPEIADVRKGIARFRKFGPDVVIAAGGGNAMDTAKLINLLAAQKGSPAGYLKKQKRIAGRGKPLIAIPTTAGTGSEATHFAVAYIAAKKYSLAHPFLLPDVAVVDPQFTLSLPSYISASGGMDALCQAVESYWSVHATKRSKQFAKEAIKLIMDNLARVVKRPTRRSRCLMAYAAHLSGEAINITKTTAAHAVSYPFTSCFGVAHGHAVALTLGEFFVYNEAVEGSNVQGVRKAGDVKKTMRELDRLLGCRDAAGAKKKINGLMRRIGLATRISDLGIKSEKDIRVITDNVDAERLENNPRKVSARFIHDMLRRLL